MATSTTNSTATKTSLLVRLLIAGGTCLALVTVFAFCVWQFGFVVGEEFNPATFKRRKFVYYEIPILGLQVVPVTRTDQTNALETHISKLPTFQTQPSAAWDLVSLMRPGQWHTDGDAGLLCAYLDLDENAIALPIPIPMAAPGGSNQLWLKWSKDNPQLAKVLWPVVARLARNRMYIFIPAVMELAKGADDPRALQSTLDKHLAQQYSDLAVKQAELEKHALAVSLWDESLTYKPDAKTKALREKSFERLSEDEKEQISELAAERQRRTKVDTELDINTATAEKPAAE